MDHQSPLHPMSPYAAPARGPAAAAISHWVLGTCAALAVLSPAATAEAQNYEILDQRLDASRHGYTVVRLWGTHGEMGHAMGVAFAQDIVGGVTEVRAQVGAGWPELRAAMATTVWQPAEVADELDGVVAGIAEVVPAAGLDVLDLKILNAFSDWHYVSGCRSHSCTGSFVAAPVQSLSTRRLDYATPFAMALHHVLCAWDPSDGSVRWVNLAWPGYVTAISGINAYGTLASLHDYGAGAAASGGLMPRSVAARLILTGMGALPIAEHRGWAQQQLASFDIATSSFINYFVPGTMGGVFTCPSGGPCDELRAPQSDYFGGEVLITTNTQTDGHSVPAGGEFMHAYYEQGGVKDLASHFELMGTDGLHLLSVEVRGPEDMTIWARGRGRTDRLELEWSALYASSGAGGSAATGGAGPIDSGTGAATSDGGGSGAAASATGPSPSDAPSSSGCGCRTPRSRPRLAPTWLVAMAAAVALRSRRAASRRRGTSPR